MLTRNRVIWKRWADKMKTNIKFLEDKIKHNQAQLDKIYPIKAELEKLSLDIGHEHIADAVKSIYLALADIVEDSNQYHRLIKQSAQQGNQPDATTRTFNGLVCSCVPPDPIPGAHHQSDCEMWDTGCGWD